MNNKKQQQDLVKSLTTVPGLQKYTVSNLIACLFIGMIKAYNMDFVRVLAGFELASLN